MNEEIINKQLKQKEMIFVLMNKPLEDLKKYFIKSELTQNEPYCDVQFNINHAFVEAVRNHNNILAKYLLTSSDLEIKPDIHFNNDKAIYYACCNSDQEFVEYLLGSPDLKAHSVFPTKIIDLENIVQEICENISCTYCEMYESNYDPNSSTGKQLDAEIKDYYKFLNYLIDEKEIFPSENIILSLKNFTDKSFYEDIIKKLTLNERYHSLNVNLSDDNFQEIKRVKI